MANLGEMVIQQAFKSAGDVPDISGAVSKGAELAAQVQAIQQNREKLEMAKEQLALTKFDKVVSILETGLTKVPKAARKSYFQNFLRNNAGQLGINISDDFIAGIQSPDINPGLLAKTMADYRDAYRKGLRSGDMSLAKGMASDMQQAFEGDVTKFAPIMNSIANSETAAFAQEQGRAQGAQKLHDQLAATDARNLKKRRESYANQLQKYAIPEIEKTLSVIDKNVIPGGLDGFDGKTDIEGITGDSAKVSSGHLSKKAQNNRRDATALANIVLKMRSGAAVSDQEATRMLQEIGMDIAVGEGGGWKTVFVGTKDPSTFVQGVRNIRGRADAVKRNAQAGAGADAVADYEKNLPPEKVYPQVDHSKVERVVAQLKARFVGDLKFDPAQARPKLAGQGLSAEEVEEVIKQMTGGNK